MRIEKARKRPTNGAEFFGEEVREWRIRAGMSQRELGEEGNYGQQYVAKVEAGERLASEDFARTCDRVFGTPGTFFRLRKRASEYGYPEWFVPYLQLERQAKSISDYSPSLIFGMLQTADYARAVFRAANPRADAEEIEAKVARRLQRREVLEREDPPLVWCVLHEACLRTAVGGPTVMRAQLDHLLAEAESPHLTLQVLPFAVGAPPAKSSFVVLTFDEGPDAAYAESEMAAQLVDSPTAVAEAFATYDRLRAAALHPDQSLALIRKVMEEYAP